jgi:alpha-tubulin suppressor-like RCC1 family protein
MELRRRNLGLPICLAILLLTAGGAACEDGALTEPRGANPTGPWTSVSVGSSFACATTTEMRLYCWGDNAAGQLGAGAAQRTQDCEAPCSAYPVAVIGDLRFASVSAGGSHACGLTPDGEAYCWGSNEWGQLGAPTSETCSAGPCSSRPVRVSGTEVWSSITAGGEHTCALNRTGRAYCWGRNFWGQLGTGARSQSGGTSTPTPATGGLTFSALSAGPSHTCGLTAGGTTTAGRAFCWGANHAGQLGAGIDRWSERPIAVVGGLTFAAISAESHSCAVTVDQRAYCWGENASGQLGLNLTNVGPENCSPRTILACSRRPVAVVGGLRFSTVSPGTYHTCALATDNLAYCWGINSWGQLGVGSATPSTDSGRPVPVAGRIRFQVVSSGDLATCGVTVDGVAYCWGSNEHGQLGAGLTASIGIDGPGATTPTIVLPPPPGA